MSVDQAVIGAVVARIMDDVDADVDKGAYTTNARVVRAMVVVEVKWTDEDGDNQSTVSVRVTDDDGIVARGLHAVECG